MDPKPEDGAPQKTPEEVIADLTAQINDLKPKAEASSQNFERLKKVEGEKKELEEKLKANGEPSKFDPAVLKKEVDDKVSLRLAGHTPEMISEIERYAKGAGIGLLEASESPFIKKAVEALTAEDKSKINTPAPSTRIKVFNGKPITEVFRDGSKTDKQSAFETIMKKGGAKSNE